MKFDDQYATCKNTYATLRIYHKSASPENVTSKLGLRPSDKQQSGDLNPRSKTKLVFKLSGWFLTTKNKIKSKDSQRHIYWILQRLKNKNAALKKLRKAGWWMDISCYWLSQSGHGGPALSPFISKKLAQFEIETWYDIYFLEAPVRDGKGKLLVK